MIHYWHSSKNVKNSIFIPKYYDPDLTDQLEKLRKTHTCQTIGDMVKAGIISTATGNEIGKSAYGSGDIPFVRTSDIANWEIKSTPKQGISHEIYEQYATDQDVKPGDILFVRDGTYLIGNNCFIQEIDKSILYQSHILKIRVNDKTALNPYLLFLSINNPWVQHQARTKQFTADTIDTLGNRFFELILPLPKDTNKRKKLARECKNALTKRIAGKAFVKHFPKIMEEALTNGSEEPIIEFLAKNTQEMINSISSETVTAEFGSFFTSWRSSATIKNQVYLPTYYADDIPIELNSLSSHCDLRTIKSLAATGEIEFHTGDEIGKMAYGTGSIPFLRTSDFSNWEVLHNPKQGVSEEIFHKYAFKQDLRENDVLLVRDGTYLVGSSCIITERDVKSLFCGGMFKFRIKNGILDPFLFLGLMNAYIVKRQMRTKQFTRDVIDTLGNRIEEVILPIPKERRVRQAISKAIETVVRTRISARDTISRLSLEVGLTDT